MANLKAVYTKPLSSLDDLGQQLAFYIRALVAAPAAAVRYQKEVMRILAEVTLGSGSLAVIGGTVGVIVSMTFFTGAQVGLSGYAALDQIGTAPLSIASFIRRSLISVGRSLYSLLPWYWTMGMRPAATSRVTAVSIFSSLPKAAPPLALSAT